jgi:DNA-directed RNA polymerase specialized sigma24 family protein
VDTISQLEFEWPVLCAGAVAQAFPSWRRAEPALARFEGARQLLEALHRARRGESDAPLHALLRLAATDRLAGRVCLQAIVPALKAFSVRIPHRHDRREELWALLLASAWEAICSYPQQRSRRVAANLVLQVLHETTRELRRAELPLAGAPSHSRDVPAGNIVLVPIGEARKHEAPAAARPGGVEGLVAAAVSAGVIGGFDGELVLLSRVDAIPLRVLAASLGLPYDRLRKRRQRAEARLRARLG